MSRNRRIIMTCPVAAATLANQKLAMVNSSWDGTFGKSGLANIRGGSRELPATHYLCNWLLTDAELAQVQTALSVELTAGTIIMEKADKDDARPGQGKTPEQVLQERNLQRYDIPDSQKTGGR